jgi:hypothetical protein
MWPTDKEVGDPWCRHPSLRSLWIWSQLWLLRQFFAARDYDDRASQRHDLYPEQLNPRSLVSRGQERTVFTGTCRLTLYWSSPILSTISHPACGLWHPVVHATTIKIITESFTAVKTSHLIIYRNDFESFLILFSKLLSDVVSGLYASGIYTLCSVRISCFIPLWCVVGWAGTCWVYN